MNKTHIEKIAASEKALREIHQEYGKLKEKSERYHTIIRSKHLANSDVLQQRVEELTLQLKEKDNNEMLLEGQIEELEDEVRILKAQLSGDAGSVAPRSSKKVRLCGFAYFDINQVAPLHRIVVIVKPQGLLLLLPPVHHRLHTAPKAGTL